MMIRPSSPFRKSNEEATDSILSLRHFKLRSLAVNSEIKDAITCLVELSLELMNATQGAFLSADDVSKMLRFDVVAVKHGTADALKRISEKLVGETVAYGVGLTGKAASTRTIQFSTRSSGDSFSHVRGDGEPNAVLAVPVIRGNQLLGVLTAVCFDRELSFSDEAARQYQLASRVVSKIL